MTELEFSTFYSGPLVLRRIKKDTFSRDVRGFLLNPPQLYVIDMEGDYGMPAIRPVKFEVARVLAPEDFRAVCRAMDAERSREWDDWAKEQKAKA